VYYVYVLRNRHKEKWYYGYTNNLRRRLTEHEKNDFSELVYYEAYRAEADARQREWQLKHYAQALTALKSRLTASIE